MYTIKTINANYIIYVITIYYFSNLYFLLLHFFVLAKNNPDDLVNAQEYLRDLVYAIRILDRGCS